MDSLAALVNLDLPLMKFAKSFIETVVPSKSFSGDEMSDDPVNHPKHYTNHPSGVECITVTRHMNFNRGNAIKYIWRAGDKGNEVQDLKKAIWYLQDEIQRLKMESRNES